VPRPPGRKSLPTAFEGSRIGSSGTCRPMCGGRYCHWVRTSDGRYWDRGSSPPRRAAARSPGQHPRHSGRARSAAEPGTGNCPVQSDRSAPLVPHSRHRTRRPRSEWTGALRSACAIRVWTEKTRAMTRPGRQSPGSPPPGVVAGSGESSVGSRRAWCRGTPPRRQVGKSSPARGQYTRRAEATRRPTRDRHLSGTVGS
jgi:hypothetical protein